MILPCTFRKSHSLRSYLQQLFGNVSKLPCNVKFAVCEPQTRIIHEYNLEPETSTNKNHRMPIKKADVIVYNIYIYIDTFSRNFPLMNLRVYSICDVQALEAGLRKAKARRPDAVDAHGEIRSGGWYWFDDCEWTWLLNYDYDVSLYHIISQFNRVVTDCESSAKHCVTTPSNSIPGDRWASVALDPCWEHIAGLQRRPRCEDGWHGVPYQNVHQS